MKGNKKLPTGLKNSQRGLKKPKTPKQNLPEIKRYVDEDGVETIEVPHDAIVFLSSKGPEVIRRHESGGGPITLSSLSPNSGWARFLDIMSNGFYSQIPPSQRYGFKNICINTFLCLMFAIFGRP